MGFEQDEAQDEALAAAQLRRDLGATEALTKGPHDKLLDAGEVGDDDEVMKDK